MIHRQTSKRSGFTLIELLVVMAIIAVLVSLTTAAVMTVLGKRNQVTTTSEISQLQAAVGQFKAKYEVDYMPSRLFLSETGNYAAQSGDTPEVIKLKQDSKEFLEKMFRNRSLHAQQRDWNGNGTIDTAGVTLEGQQCLVFFLGGIPTNSPAAGPHGVTGFGESNPAAPGGRRVGPFFEFKSNRLRRDANGFLSYLDGYGSQPYAYFDAHGGGGYNRYPSSSDCQSLGLSPYMQSATQFCNSKSFQIISAGKDKRFGPGGQWVPGAVASTPPDTRDDLSNFHDRMLGAP